MGAFRSRRAGLVSRDPVSSRDPDSLPPEEVVDEPLLSLLSSLLELLLPVSEVCSLDELEDDDDDDADDDEFEDCDE